MLATNSMEQPVKIAIMLLNYNGLKYLPRFFKHADFLRDHPNAEIFLIDNASIDDSLDWMSSQASWVQVIRNDANYGFSEGYNRGVAALSKLGKSFTHYMFLNNDVQITPAWFSEIVRTIESSDSVTAEFGCRSVFMAPYVREAVFTAESNQISKLRCHLATYPSSSNYYFDKRSKSLNVVAKVFTKNLDDLDDISPTARAGGYYQIELTTNSLTPTTIQIAAGFSGQIEPITDVSAVLTIWKSGESSQPITVKIDTGKLLKIRRVLTDEELFGLPPIIQNSGIGINDVFEGFDLHCFQPVTTPQDHRATKGICGVCKTVRVEVFHELGGFDKNIFMYYEDLDLSLRLQKRGYRSQVVESAILIHDHSGTSNNHSAFFTRQVAWSLFYFHWRHGTFLRRLRTWLRFRLLSHAEKGSCTNPFSRYHELARERFRTVIKSHYLLGRG